MSGSHYAPEPGRNARYERPSEATQYDLASARRVQPDPARYDCRTLTEREDAEIARLDRRIDSLQAEIVRLVDVVQIMRLQMEDDGR